MKIGLLILACMFSLALVGPQLTGYTYYEIELELKNMPPDRHHWFGTDDLGRDLFTRVFVGARISLAIGIAAALLDLGVGVLFGGIAGLAGGKIDIFMMRTADILYSLPYLLIAILLLVLMGPGIISLLAAMTAIGWITMARVVRGQTLQLKNQEFVLAAEALGAGFGTKTDPPYPPQCDRTHHRYNGLHHPRSHLYRSFFKLSRTWHSSPSRKLGNDGERRVACPSILSLASFLPRNILKRHTACI